MSQKAINGRTALMVAADGGYLDITTLLVDAGAAVNTADTDGKKTALHLAVEGKHPEVVKVLLEANANPSARVRDGRTPLHAACWIGDVRIIDLLVSAGSDPQASTKGTHKMVPLDFAAESGQREAIGYMISTIGLASCGGDSAGVIALQKAAFHGQIDALRTLASFGVQDTRGVALVGAILWETDDECAKFLLRQYEEHALGHINSATDCVGRSALSCAAGKSPKKVQWLLEAGADATALFDLGGIYILPLNYVDTLIEAREEEDSKEEEDKRMLVKAIRRTLLRAPAIQGVSWDWGRRTTTSTDCGVLTVVPRIRRVAQRERSRVVLGGLMR